MFIGVRFFIFLKMYLSFCLGIGICDVIILKSKVNSMNWWSVILSLCEIGLGCIDKKC